jgi:hypothetical protein
MTRRELLAHSIQLRPDQGSETRPRPVLRLNESERQAVADAAVDELRRHGRIAGSIV